MPAVAVDSQADRADDRGATPVTRWELLKSARRCHPTDRLRAATELMICESCGRYLYWVEGP